MCDAKHDDITIDDDYEITVFFSYAYSWNFDFQK